MNESAPQQNPQARIEELEQAIRELLSKRSATEWTYEDAYDFTFKSWGRDAWAKLKDLTGWNEAEGLKWRTDNNCLLDGELPYQEENHVSTNCN